MFYLFGIDIFFFLRIGLHGLGEGIVKRAKIEFLSNRLTNNELLCLFYMWKTY